MYDLRFAMYESNSANISAAFLSAEISGKNISRKDAKKEKAQYDVRLMMYDVREQFSENQRCIFIGGNQREKYFTQRCKEGKDAIRFTIYDVREQFSEHQRCIFIGEISGKIFTQSAKKTKTQYDLRCTIYDLLLMMGKKLLTTDYRLFYLRCTIYDVRFVVDDG